ncbi:DUF2251 domain-containing protein [Pseudomonas cremoricolorata]|uniref:DUF2251 domain-containing protein n=1 Tax=Pseudomonas cremoricolorata TaxID=157783 RepID=A0A089WR11_9PSED|nr:DUF2251 domain-containing protein [Pseudomonas cremoricolorata]AIR91021.1 hypothetical protein LK03_17880 [Pseudomonas cremoricolorata]
MPIYLAAESEWLPGTELVIEGPAAQGPYAAVFEDDGETGYFYALDSSKDDNPIQDALHVYNVQDISDREKASTVRIGWSQDHLKAVLLINDYPHAVFDFHSKRGYCRSSFPRATGNGWSKEGHDWSDEALQLFA